MHLTASETKRSVRAICRRFGVSRQAFYKAAKARSRKEVNEGLILALVRQEREVNPCAGTKKLLVAIRPALREAGFDIGRNRLGELLKREGLLVEPRRVFRCRTTKQDPSLVPSPNLVRGMTFTAPDQALCSDITYIYTEEGFLFLSLMADMFVRDIVGWAVSDTLETEDGPLKALKMAAKSVGPGKEVVSHSDRGCQYGSRAYRELLEALGWKSSMTEELHCYENAMAERLNGILKCEYFLDRHFKTKAEARKAIEEAIWIYNHRRLHEKLGYKTGGIPRRMEEGGMIPARQDFTPCRTGRGLAASRRPFGDVRFPVRHGVSGVEVPPRCQATQLNNEVSTLSGDLTLVLGSPYGSGQGRALLSGGSAGRLAPPEYTWGQTPQQRIGNSEW